MTDKNDELVLVVPKSALSPLGFPGIMQYPNSLLWKKRKFAKVVEQGVYKKRRIVETSETEVQLIPYVVVRTPRVNLPAPPPLYLTYNRGTKGGEKRLAEQWSIGVGGHINPVDAVHTYRKVDMLDVTNAAKRELKEELQGLDTHVLSTLDLIGLFYNKDTPVNAVHMGIVFTAIADSKSFTKMGDGVEEYKWCTEEELKRMKLEAWSETVLQNFMEV